MGKFLIRQTASGFTFCLKAGNGEVVGTSEAYKSEASCRNGIASVQKNAPAAAVEDQTKESFEKQKNPKFEIYADKAGEFRFRLKAGNGEVILASEGYKSAAGCKNGIASVQKNAPDSETVKEEN